MICFGVASKTCSDLPVTWGRVRSSFFIFVYSFVLPTRDRSRSIMVDVCLHPERTVYFRQLVVTHGRCICWIMEVLLLVADSWSLTVDDLFASCAYSF